MSTCIATPDGFIFQTYLVLLAIRLFMILMLNTLWSLCCWCQKRKGRSEEHGRTLSNSFHSCDLAFAVRVTPHRHAHSSAPGCFQPAQAQEKLLFLVEGADSTPKRMRPGLASPAPTSVPAREPLPIRGAGTARGDARRCVRAPGPRAGQWSWRPWHVIPDRRGSLVAPSVCPSAGAIMADAASQVLLGSGLTILSQPLMYVKVLIQVWVVAFPFLARRPVRSPLPKAPENRLQPSGPSVSWDAAPSLLPAPSFPAGTTSTVRWAPTARGPSRGLASQPSREARSFPGIRLPPCPALPCLMAPLNFVFSSLRLILAGRRQGLTNLSFSAALKWASFSPPRPQTQDVKSVEDKFEIRGEPTLY